MTRDFSSKPHRPVAVAPILWVSLGALALAASVAFSISARIDLSNVQHRLAAASTELDATQDRVHALKATKWPTDEIVGSQIILTATAPPSALFAALEQTLPADVRLVGLSLAYGRQVDVDMRIAARRSEAYDEFLAKLAQSQAFHDVVPAAESREEGVQASVHAQFGAQP